MLLRQLLIISLFFATAGGFIQQARAVIIKLHDGGRTVHGHLVQLTPQTLVVDQLAPDGTSTRREFSREEISELTLNVSDERLNALDPQNPEAYFQYAEELFPRREDPDAQLAACRLYLIAGHLDSARFGEPSLQRLITLARSATEERTFRSMLYLLQAEQQKSTRVGLTEREDHAFLHSAGVEGLVNCLRAIRSGDRRVAMRLLANAEVREALRRLHGELTADQLEQLAHGECESCLDGRIDCDRCQGKGRVMHSGGEIPCAPCRGSGLLQCTTCRGRDFFTRPNNVVLRQLLELELRIMRQRESQGSVIAKRLPPDYRNWSLASQQVPAAKLLLDWTNVTEIDPRQTVFVGDRWVRP